jgi:hypothetical protein
MEDIPAPRRQLSKTQRIDDCRAAVEPSFYQIIEFAAEKGWEPTEVVMALADVADDYIMFLASKHTVTH